MSTDDQIPRCPQHGELVRRPREQMSPEQAWCGEWWDCRNRALGSVGHCGVTVCVPSPALVAQLAEQRALSAQQSLPMGDAIDRRRRKGDGR
jgi:hypothetical protein